MGDIKHLDHYQKRNPGNGAREALIECLGLAPVPENGMDALADYILAWLWTQGFKIVPLNTIDK